MNLPLWTVALGVFCLLQRPVAGDPRPDFALDSPLFGTAYAVSAVNDALAESDSVVANLELTLESNSALLAELLATLNGIGNAVKGDAMEVLTPLGTLAPSSDPTQFALFDQVLAEVEELQGAFSTTLQTIASSLAPFEGSCLTAQLTDAVTRIFRGLAALHQALMALKLAVHEVLQLPSGPGPSCQRVKPQLVYEVVYAVRNLRAYLPVVTYSLSSTVESVAIADAFLVRLSHVSTETEDPTYYVNLLTSEVTATVTMSSDMESVVTTLSQTNTAVQALTNIQTAASYSNLMAMFDNFNMALVPGFAQSAFQSSLSALGPFLQTVLTDVEVPQVDSSAVVNALVLTLVSGCPYGRYCFYKYSELLFGVAGFALNSVETCIYREVERLQFLQETLARHVTMLMFDLEDVTENLTVCDSLTDAQALDQCVTWLTAFYVPLSTNFAAKVVNLFTVGTSEVTASQYRLGACVRVLQAGILGGSFDVLVQEVAQCAQNGPGSV